jgi:hypothetical protein
MFCHIFGSNKSKVGEQFTPLHNEELHDLCKTLCGYDPDKTKELRMSWTCCTELREDFGGETSRKAETLRPRKK